MSTTAAHSIAAWLSRLQAGEPEAFEHLVPLVYQELREVARRQLAREPRTPTLSATTLVHEAYLRLRQQRQINAADRDGFLAVAAQTMRRVLVDHARWRRRLKRGGQDAAVSLETRHERALLTETQAGEILAVDAVLARLAALDERAARVVEYRVFAGLTLEETAAALNTSTKTVQRSWVTARAWLRKEIGASAATGATPAATTEDRHDS
jgi:RNA polymerase sigma factor (TIGR02999 family)